MHTTGIPLLKLRAGGGGMANSNVVGIICPTGWNKDIPPLPVLTALKNVYQKQVVNDFVPWISKKDELNCPLFWKFDFCSTSQLEDFQRSELNKPVVCKLWSLHRSSGSEINNTEIDLLSNS